jgi:hypothetical protein
MEIMVLPDGEPYGAVEGRSDRRFAAMSGKRRPGGAYG